jgi:hypothetical protein
VKRESVVVVVVVVVVVAKQRKKSGILFFIIQKKKSGQFVTVFDSFICWGKKQIETFIDMHPHIHKAKQ